jgi:hypothetical protein
MSQPRRSRLAQRLDDAITASAADPVRQACLQTQRALLWARQGRDAESRVELDRLHAQVLQHPSAELAAWLHFAEALIAYFHDFPGAARERMARAEVMAAAVGARGLQALAQGWLAHLAFIERDPEALVQQARSALTLAEQAGDAAAHYRAATALALAWSFVGDTAAGAAWFAVARKQALTDGDDAGISALLYNQTQMRALNLRHAALRGQPGEAPAVLLGLDSVGHYDLAVGGSARADLTPILRAQLLTVHGDYAEAAALLQTHLPAAMAAGLSRLGGSLLADLAWCWVKTAKTSGDFSRAKALADQAAAEVLAETGPNCDIDDRAALHARLAQVYTALADPAAAGRESAEAEQAWAEYDRQCQAWTALLDAAGLRP